jgi:hypothetical protein
LTFTPFLADLLCNEDLINGEHLIFSDSNFMDIDAGIPDDDMYDDINTGMWWKQSVERIKVEHQHLQQDHSVLCLCKEKFLLCNIIV